MPERGLRFWVPYVVFFLSGLASLADEIVWFKYLTLTFGATTAAAATLVAVFMGGLALGSALAGKAAARLRNPARVYALLETGVALFALATPSLFEAVDRGYVAAYPHVSGSPAGLLAVRFGLAAAVLLAPTILMGASLPVLARAAERGDMPGRPSTTLYAVNTAGAVAGVALAGFVLIPVFGFWATLVASACTSLGAALLGLMLRAPATAPPAAVRIPTSPVPMLWIAVAFLAGAAAMADEVLWTRILVLYIGSSVYAFSLMLGVYLTGLVAGSAAAAALRPRDTRLVLSTTQTALAFVLLAQVAAFAFYTRILVSTATGILHAAGWGGLVAAETITTALFLLPPTILMGLTFGIVVRAASPSSDAAPRGVGVIYSSNTVGGILGALAAGFIAIPLVGSQRGLLATGLVGLAVALVLRPRSRIAWSAPVVFLLFTVPLKSDGVILSAGTLSDVARKDLIHYEEDTTATVAVKRYGLPSPSLSLELNGVNVAGTAPDLVTIQKLQAHLPLAFCRNPKRVLHIGFGSGDTAYSVSLHPVSDIRIVEISPEVVGESARYFAGINHGVLSDVRVHLTINDGRNYILAATGQFDAILSDSIHPRYAGNGSLYTEDYFRLCARRLAPGGVISMWLPMYSVLPDNFRAIVRAFQDVFPNVSIWYPHSVENPFTIVLATPGPTVRWDDVRASLSAAAVSTDLATIGEADPAELLSNLLLAPRDVERWVARTSPHTDDLPVVEYESGRTVAPTATWLATFTDLVSRRSRIQDFVEGLTPGDPASDRVLAAHAAAATALGRHLESLRRRAATEP
ncbi:MAG TPA: fused MFS/spermidine synthase [Thermoanaerobaculia bacterium]|nr:fused MFS/spermidine synthase [Thermoanaerobaculia bacterium]